MSSLPLAGRRVLVTRAAHQAGKLSEGLRALGAEPVEVPVLEIRPPGALTPLDAALAPARTLRLADPDQRQHGASAAERAAALGNWIGAACLAKGGRGGGSDSGGGAQGRVRVAFVPETYVAESLVEGLLAAMAPGRESCWRGRRWPAT